MFNNYFYEMKFICNIFRLIVFMKFNIYSVFVIKFIVVFGSVEFDEDCVFLVFIRMVYRNDMIFIKDKRMLMRFG